MDEKAHLFSGLGEALLWMRNRRSLRQGVVAERAGVTSSQLSSYERGRTLPNLLTLSRILEAMEYELQDLVDALVVQRGPLGAEREPAQRAPRRSPPDADLLARVSHQLLGIILDRYSPRPLDAADPQLRELLGLPSAGAAKPSPAEPAPRARRAGRR